MGRKTLARFCADEGVDLDVVLEQLRAVGIETSGEALLWDIAEENDMRPFDLVDLLRGKP